MSDILPVQFPRNKSSLEAINMGKACAISSVILGLLLAWALPCAGQNVALPESHKVLVGLPLSFEPNMGQADSPYTFIFHSAGFGARFCSGQAEFSVPGSSLHRQAVTLKFVGSDPTFISPEDPLPGKINYQRGPNPSKWIRNVPAFGSIRYHSLYPGIDLRFYGNGEHVEHDFIVAPGSDPAAISVQIQTNGKVQLDNDGNLLVDTEDSILTFQKPIAYQTTPQGKKLIAANFRLTGRTFSFELGGFDPTLTLVIDPILTYSTFLAGSQMDTIAGISVDATGNAYVTGSTTSTDFPTKSPYQASCAGSYCQDIFVTKLNPAGNALVYSTYIGGSSGDFSSGIAVDTNGNAIVTGYTNSVDFPTKNSYATFPPYTNAEYVFVLSLSSDGTALNYSSLLGQIDLGSVVFAVAADHQGFAYVTGQTNDVMFPITPGTVGTTVPGYPNDSMFVTKLANSGSLVYSTVIPGTLALNPGSNDNNFIPFGIAVDASDAAYIGGNSGPGLPTTSGVLSPDFPGDPNDPAIPYGFALKLNAKASKIIYATYLPSTYSITAVALPNAETLYVAGQTYSPTFPATKAAYQTECPPGQNVPCSAGFIAKFDATASEYLFATFLAGTPASSNIGTTIQSIATASNGAIWVGGITASANFPLKNPIVSLFPPTPSAGFVSELNADLSTLEFSTFLNGQENLFNHTVQLYVAAGAPGVAFTAGTTGDSDFPTTPASFQPVLPNPTGQTHGFIAEINTNVAAPSVCLSSYALNFGTWLIYTPSPAQIITVQNCGNAPLQIQNPVITNSDFAETNTCAAPIASGNSCKISVTFTPSSLYQETGSLTFTDNAGVVSQTISLSGQGGVPQLYAPASLNLGDALVGTSVSPQSGYAVLFNTGDANLIVTNVSITGDFSFQNFCNTPTGPLNACFIVLTFTPSAPGTRTGTLTVTDNAAGSPQVIQLTGNGLTAYPFPSVAAIQAVPVTTSGGTLQMVGNYFFPATVVLWHGSPRPTTYIDETDLTVALTAADLAQIGQIDVNVVNPAPGGGTSKPALATVYLSIPQTTADMKYDSTQSLIYASVPAGATTNPNTLLVINPQTGDITKIVPLANNPDRLALTDDNKYLYVGLDQTGQVVRLSTQSWKVLDTIQLPFDSYPGQTVAQDMAAIPGTPESVVVSLGFTNVSPQSGGVIVYDGAKPRPVSIPQWIDGPNVAANSISFLGSEKTIVYASDVEAGDSFYRFNLNGSGISLKDTTSTVNSGILTTDGVLFYEANGNVIDPTIPGEVNTYKTSDGGSWSAVTPQLARESIYASEPGISPYPLLFYQTLFARANINTLHTVESVIFPWLGEPVQDILSWGQSGVAMRVAPSNYLLLWQPNPSDAIIVFNDSAVKPGSVNIIATDPVLSVDKGSGDYVITLTLKNNGDLPATYVEVAQASLAVAGGQPIGTSSVLPISTSLAAGATIQITLDFPSTVGAAGSKAVLALTNEPFSFDLPGGSPASGVWSSSLNVVLPH
jgi:hypothetical protein